jgi:hypothetical protein
MRICARFTVAGPFGSYIGQLADVMYRRAGNRSPDATDRVSNRGATTSVASEDAEAVMKRMRIARRRVRGERPWLEALRPDPRDPDIVRAKAIVRTARRREASGK